MDNIEQKLNGVDRKQDELAKKMDDFIEKMDDKYTKKDEFVFWRNVLIAGLIGTVAAGIIVRFISK